MPNKVTFSTLSSPLYKNVGLSYKLNQRNHFDIEEAIFFDPRLQLSITAISILILGKKEINLNFFCKGA